MKPEEAILWIEDTKYIYENMNPDIELSKLKCEAFNLAIQALEKQVPKKPINDKCENCGEDVRNWTGDDNFKYCPECGQRIDWSE